LAEIGCGPRRAGPAGHSRNRDHRRDAARRGAAQRIGDDQQLHQVVVGRERGRLDDEDILAAHVLLDLDEDLHVGEAPDGGLGERNAEMAADRLGKRAIELPATTLKWEAMP
jgi:hypothetical protein